MRQPTTFDARRGIASYGLTSKLPGWQHQPQSGNLLLTVRAERNVGRSRYAEWIQSR
jgi:hypothetical protein